MAYDVNVPNASQSPFYTPAQATENFTRLKTIINAEHVFNDSIQVTDGVHRQVTLVNRSDPVSVPAGTNCMVFSKLSNDAVTDLFYYDAINVRQINWREARGTVAISSSNVAVTSVPGNCYGEIFMYIDTATPGVSYMQAGTFTSDASGVSAFAYAEKYSSSDAGQILNFGNSGSGGASGLNIMARNVSGSTYNGTWQYRILYRLK